MKKHWGLCTPIMSKQLPAVTTEPDITIYKVKIVAAATPQILHCNTSILCKMLLITDLHYLDQTFCGNGKEDTAKRQWPELCREEKDTAHKNKFKMTKG